jgi:Protein of unknown function (DUF2971)
VAETQNDESRNNEGLDDLPPATAPVVGLAPLPTQPLISEEQSARYMRWVQGELNRIDRSKARPAFLWHYTTGQGAIDIITSGTLWTTQVSCLNDSTEFTHASVVLRQAMVNLINDPAAPDDKRDLYRRRLEISQAQTLPTAPNYPFFVACFSEDGDDLSQWRAYGGGEGGVALGFHPSNLLQWGPENRMLLPVQYERNVQDEQARRVLDAVYDYFVQDVASRHQGERAECENQFFLAWGVWLNYLAPIFKNDAFRGEKEWRIVKQVQLNDLNNLRQLKFRQRQSMISRHFPLALGGSASLPCPHLPLSAVTIGPSRYKLISEESIRLLLITRGYDLNAVNVTSSPTPFQAH